ncbi:MAG: hypothetical protein K2M06_01955 [Muribaculaceae bacterium]|nr:hypothetical protein [Muribaculaceae bacterium]
MSNEIIPASRAIIAREENTATIVKSGPQSYSANHLSCQRCTEAGNQLLEECQHGMSDELDQRIASYIEKTRKTMATMNERRSPITKLFDRVRSEFTSLENAIDPTRADSIPYKLQQLRNQYAAHKRKEEEERRAAELAARELRHAKESFRVAVEEDYRRAFNNCVTEAIVKLADLSTTVTLESYDTTLDALKNYDTALPDAWSPLSGVPKPYNLSEDEANKIRSEEFLKLLPDFEEQYPKRVGECRDDILDKLPSKKEELTRMASASEAEAARIKVEMAMREASDAAQRERLRLQAEEEARRKAEADKANAEMAGLFDMAKAEAAYTPKTKVSKKIEITDPQAFLPLLSMWWQRQGGTMSVEELTKMFKKQITFCEKLADKENIFVQSPGLRYVDEVKAK